MIAASIRYWKVAPFTCATKYVFRRSATQVLAPMRRKPSSASSPRAHHRNPCPRNPPVLPAPNPSWNRCPRDQPVLPGRRREKKRRRPAHDYRPPPRSRTRHHDTSLDGYIRRCPDLFGAHSPRLDGARARCHGCCHSWWREKDKRSSARTTVTGVTGLFQEAREKEKSGAAQSPLFPILPNNH